MAADPDDIVSAAYRGDFLAVRRFLAIGAHSESTRYNAFIGATFYGRAKVVEELLNDSVYTPYALGEALDSAVRRGFPKVVRVLLGARPPLDCVGTLAEWVADKKNAETIRLLQKYGKEV